MQRRLPAESSRRNPGVLAVNAAQLLESLQLLRNDQKQPCHWVLFKMAGRKSNRDGIGARITVVTEKLEQIWEIKRTVGIYSASDPRAHFGLGSFEKIDLVKVRWPGGTVQEFRNVPADHHYAIDERDGLKTERIR